MVPTGIAGIFTGICDSGSCGEHSRRHLCLYRRKRQSRRAVHLLHARTESRISRPVLRARRRPKRTAGQNGHAGSFRTHQLRKRTPLPARAISRGIRFGALDPALPPVLGHAAYGQTFGRRHLYWLPYFSLRLATRKLLQRRRRARHPGQTATPHSAGVGCARHNCS